MSSSVVSAFTFDGSTPVEIVLGASPSSTESYAARELKRALDLAIPSPVSIAAEGASSDSDSFKILLGTGSAHPGIATVMTGMSEQLGSLAEEEIWVKEVDNRYLVLTGGSPKATLYATYTFLEEVVGFRWYWPGPTGEFVPEKGPVKVTDLDIRQSPSIAMRGLHLTAVPRNHHEETEIWMARNKMNFTLSPILKEERIQKRRERGMFYRYQGHNVTLPAATLKEHPEYIAELNGKRVWSENRHGHHLCWSNPDVKRLVADRVRQWWDENPEIDLMGLYPVDQTNYCTCANCTAIGDTSTQWQKFTSDLLADLEKTHPGRRHATLAYAVYRNPSSGPAAKVDLLEYCLYDRSYRKLLTDDDPLNKAAVERIKEWKAKGAPMGIYGYEFDIFSDRKFVPLVSYAVDQMEFYKREGIISFLTETRPYNYPPTEPPAQQAWNCFRQSIYATARALWNADISAEQIVADWSGRIYGPAASAMERYYWRMEEAWRNAPGNVTYVLHPSSAYVKGFITRELLDEAAKLFLEARSAIADLPAEKRERILGEIELEEGLLGEWAKLYDLRLEAERRYRFPVGYRSDSSGEEKGRKFPPFVTRDDEESDYPTEMHMSWDDENLYIELECHEGSDYSLSNNYTERDSKVWADDCVEIFLVPEGPDAKYQHLAFNSKGTLYDAVIHPSGKTDTAWNPDWKVATELKETSWTARVTLPFSSFGKVQEGSQWKFSIKRSHDQSRARRNSGWPNAAYHSPASLGTLVFTKSEESQVEKIVLFRPRFDTASVSINLAQSGIAIDDSITTPSALAERLTAEEVSAVVLWHPSKSGWPRATFQDVFHDYIDQGGTLIISRQGPLPFEEWFPDASLEVEWTGWTVEPNRRLVAVKDDSWASTPNDLRPILTKGITPLSAFIPLGEGWESLATLKTEEGQEHPFLLRARIGKGQIILTSSALVESGGAEVFGNTFPAHVAKLIENLILDLKRQ